MVFAELLGYADECFPSNLGEFLALISSGILSTPFSLSFPIWDSYNAYIGPLRWCLIVL